MFSAICEFNLYRVNYEFEANCHIRAWRNVTWCRTSFFSSTMCGNWLSASKRDGGFNYGRRCGAGFITRFGRNSLHIWLRQLCQRPLLLVFNIFGPIMFCFIHFISESGTSKTSFHCMDDLIWASRPFFVSLEVLCATTPPTCPVTHAPPRYGVPYMTWDLYFTCKANFVSSHLTIIYPAGH